MDILVGVVATFGLLVLVSSILLHRRRSQRDAERSLDQTLAACRSLLALTANFQQHRGMSSAWLAGDRSFAGKLQAKAGEIDALLPALRTVAGIESGKPHPCLTPNELSLFQHRWGQLREKLESLSVEQSIAQHSALIHQLLQWLAALGESRVEPVFGERGLRNAVRNYASRLPGLTECLGQARAVGMSVAARKGCSAVARVRLMFLIARAETLLGQASNGVVRGRRGEAAERAVSEMASMVRNQLLLSVGISVSVQDYFEVASRAVDGVFAWAAETGEQLHRERWPDADRPSTNTAWAA